MNYVSGMLSKISETQAHFDLILINTDYISDPYI